MNTNSVNVEFTTKKAAAAIAVSLSKPSKMPGAGYSVPALIACPVGQKIAKIAGSSCNHCYACKGNYIFPDVQAGLKKRMKAISKPGWTMAMVKLIGNQEYFRWNDSGDLFSEEYFYKILEVAAKTPNTRHWLPTREKGLISRYIKAGGFIPENLTIRLSAAMVDSKAPAMAGICTSTVHDEKPAIGHSCPAPYQGNKCGDCRACWNSDIKNVSYGKH